MIGYNGTIRNRDHNVIILPYFPHDRFQVATDLTQIEVELSFYQFQGPIFCNFVAVLSTFTLGLKQIFEPVTFALFVK